MATIATPEIRPPMDSEEEELEEVTAMQPSYGFYDNIFNLAERFSQTRIGQFVIKRCDRVLGTIETTLKWSLPEENWENLKRPLGWFGFIALILALRLARIGLSLAAIMIGNEPVSAKDMWSFVQMRRRRLRSLRTRGLRAMRHCRLEEDMKRKSATSGAIKKIYQLLLSAICRPGQILDAESHIFINSRSNEEKSIEQTSMKRPREDDCDDVHLTVNELLVKYADENSADDSDYVPNLEDDTNDSSTISSEDSIGSRSPDDAEMTNGEVAKHGIGTELSGAAKGKSQAANTKSQLEILFEIDEVREVSATMPNNKKPKPMKMDESSKLQENPLRPLRKAFIDMGKMPTTQNGQQENDVENGTCNIMMSTKKNPINNDDNMTAAKSTGNVDYQKRGRSEPIHNLVSPTPGATKTFNL